jgi:two-component system NarL family sensor kinase
VATDITEFAEANEILRKTEASLHSLSGRLLRVQDEERRRIARDFHDTTGQELAVVVMELTHLAKSLELPGTDARKVVSEAAEMVRKVEQEVRTLSYLLHPPLLDELGLASALRWYVEGINKRSAFKVSLEVPPKMRRLSMEKEMALFRVVQESLTNVLRHSGSSTARIEVAEWANQLQVSIEDEERGIEREMLLKIANGKETIGGGLAGIRERLLQFGGRLEIHSGPVGTRVVASVLAAEGEAADKTAQTAAEMRWRQAAFHKSDRSTRKRILVVDDRLDHHGFDDAAGRRPFGGLPDSPVGLCTKNSDVYDA